MPSQAGLASCMAALVLCACGGGDSSSRAGALAMERAQAVAAAPVLTLDLASPFGGTLLPFTLGQPLRQGDVPAGMTLAAQDLPELQTVITNRWPDGSAKFAIVSGRADVDAGRWRRVALGLAPQPELAAALTTADLKATHISARVDFGTFGSADWSAADWESPARTVVSGPQMSAWTYRKPIGGDAHLVAWLEVRAYKGGRVEVLPWIENGYLNVPGPTEKIDTATFTLGGTQRFSQPLALLNHTRAVLAGPQLLTHWFNGDDAQLTPRHDTAYFMRSRLVPNYSGNTSATSPLFAQLVTEYKPLMPGNFPAAMGHTGYDASIGLLPVWDVAYLTSAGDPRARRSVLVNGYAAGRYGIHYRDEKTQRPPAFSSYPNLGLRAGSGVAGISGTSKAQYTPVNTGGVPPNYTTSHSPSMGYMAYLVSGWNYFLEEAQFEAVTNFLKQSDVIRQYGKGILETSTGALTPRGAAWALRTLAQVAAVTPDDDPLRNEFTASINANIGHYHGRYVLKPSNPLGLAQPYSSYTSTDPHVSASWMDDFVTGTFAYMKGLALHDPALQTQFNAFMAWKFRAIVGRLGGSGADQFAYPYAAQYTLPFAPSLKSDWVNGTGPWYATWGEVARVMGLPTSGEPGSILDSGYRGDPTGYWGNLMPALAHAVEEQAEGAEAAWERVTSSPDYKAAFARFNDTPVWSVYPRSKPQTYATPSNVAPTAANLQPSALLELKPGHWLELPGTRLKSVFPAPAPRGMPASVITAWNGGTVDTLRSRLLVWGGGNTNYWGNEMYALELDTLSVRRIVDPSPFTFAGQEGDSCAVALPDGTPRSRATQDGLTYLPHLDSFFAVGGATSYCLNGSRPASGGVWLRDFTTSQWVLKQDTAPVAAAGVMAVYDEETRRVLIKDPGKFLAYSPETNTFTVLNAYSPVDYHLSAALDTRRRKFVMLGNGVQVIDLATNQMSTLATVNAPVLATSKQSPGVAYDPVADRIVAWHGGSDVYALDMDTLVWTQVAANPGPTVSAPVQGTNGRWGYVPKYQVFVLINGADQDAWVFKAGKAH